MPKLNIDDENTDGFRVEVGWGADTYVQVATTNAGSPFSFEPSEETSGGPFNGWFVTLDRHGVNRLIQALRKARDAAYGADA